MPLTAGFSGWTLGTYICFLNLGIPDVPGEKRKTNIYEVWTKNEDDSMGSIKLGEIRWFGRFRKYSFYPANDTIYEEVCMQEITDFLKQENKRHREKRNAANVSVS